MTTLNKPEQQEDKGPCSSNLDDANQAPTKTDEPQPTHGNTTAKFFWVTILMMAGATIALTLSGNVQMSRLAPQATTKTIEIQPTTLETFFSSAAQTAGQVIVPKIDNSLNEVYAPVYDSIPVYADFHYSVLGEYTELTEAALGQMGSGIHERLFNGFDQRIEAAASSLDHQYTVAYRTALRSLIEAELPEGEFSLPLGELTQAALQDAVSRAKVSAPIAAVAVGVVGSGAVKTLTDTMAKKLATKIAAKASAKGVLKGGGVLAGAGSGALLCSWSGPGAAVCGIVGGVGAWLLTDAVVVNLDEYFNREEFEAEIRAMIDEDKASKKVLLEAALRKKASEMDAASKELIKGFTLRELSSEGDGN